MNFSDISITCGDPMPMAILCPTKCAEGVVDELLAYVDAHPDLTERRAVMVRLVRQLVRDQFEQCAQLVECFVPENDLEEEMTGLEACDGAAEALRKLADERVLTFGGRG